MRLITPILLTGLLASSPALALQDSEDRAAARENFQQADANADRRLNKTEFKAFINANAEDNLGRASMVRRFGAYDRAFARVDANEDGYVTGNELAASRND